jgi:tocopherol O-methyltransferase
MSTNVELKEKIKDHYNKISSYYKDLWGDNIHHGFWIKGDESKEVAQEQLMQELAKVGGVFKGAKVVDVGCGVGGGSMYLTKNYNASVTGISISSEQIRMATEAAAKAGLNSIKFKEMDAEAINLPECDGKTDFIWIVEAMSHFPHKKQFLMHANRLLKKSGRIIIADWFKCEHLTPEQETGDLKSIEEGMLLPELNTMFDYISFLHERGFKVEYVRDISEQTAKTWDICLGLITNPSFWSLAWQHGSEFVSFLKSFKSMRNAFGTTFRYGIIVAEKIVEAQQA